MSVVDRARRALGQVGTYVPVPFTRWIPIDEQRKAVRRLEAAGYGTTWCNEPVGGKDVFAQLAVLMEATERMTFGTGIANVWARAAQTAHGAAAVLAEAYPDRFVLGLGVGYREQAAAVGRDFGRPAGTMRAYLDAMAEPPQMPGPDASYPRIIGANGPKMMALAATTDGAFPAHQPPEFTADARRTLGPDKLLVMGLSHNADDEPAAIAAQVKAHLAAGADHVTLFPATGDDFTADVDRLVDLAPALLS
ncbi:LLM class flavin-dependent oxidoreductase [Actinomadura montaniterrae]|nr:LLM class flavin-dependent oxidoreductase [Actinomadura montaniterrae]